MKIAVLFDGPSALATQCADLLILDTVEVVERSLAAEGNEVVRVPVHPDGRWIERIRRGKFDLAFNLCEGVDGASDLEPAVVSVLELMALPYTGSASWTTALSLRKPIANVLLDRAGLPVPRWHSVRRDSALPSVGFPAICKPAAEDASVGVEQRSVVRNARALAARVEAMLELWDEVLVQRYIDGREVNVGILGETALPIAEIDFGRMPAGLWRIVSYRSKWEIGSDEDLGGVPRCPADLPPDVAVEVRRIALGAWRTLGGHGYGRVDMRIDAAGRPWVLEVNANPDFAPDAGFARMARAAGIEYPALVRAVCELALARSRAAPSTAAHWVLARQLSGVAPPREAGVLDLFAAEAG
jgi:D-alanine-D-alanine ligase